METNATRPIYLQGAKSIFEQNVPIELSKGGSIVSFLGTFGTLSL